MPNETTGWTTTELSLAALALALGATEHGGTLSPGEERLVREGQAWPAPSDADPHATTEAIRAGLDPLGDRLIAARPQPERRRLGQVFTPDAITAPMVRWALEQSPARVVDAGCGSGRFALEVARRSDAAIVAIDADPLATLLTRAGLAALGLTRGATVVNADYTQTSIPEHDGRTAFIGNPPYVRHHDLTPDAKAWARLAAGRFGTRLSGLAGLHTYFFLATALHGRPGDIGCFVTSSEWLDVNYGGAVRHLLLDGLGGRSIDIIDPAALPFGDAATTAAVTCFEIGSEPGALLMRMVEDAADLAPLSAGRPVARARLERAHRWTPLVRTAPVMPEGYVELGEICRVHRGQVTGANATWVVPAGRRTPIPDRYLFPSVTRARELIDAGERLESTDALRRVIDLPPDLGELDSAERAEVDAFLDSARAAGVDGGYVARNRRAWWSVGLREPAPILATYMARRPPVFVRNVAGARHINIAHGIYPREPLSERALDRLAEALRDTVSLTLGRTYAGGLVKFEPREMERIPVPSRERLLED
ncbi:MAG: class I SAM-dependent methyltransferase [Chloroflexi bacterium]|nr:class I SAM-dependent methyltransferase [Chloroflexota bacterium]